MSDQPPAPPFLDCHHHLWEPRNGTHPWLEPGGEIPFRYGDYTAIRTPYLPEDYARDCAGFDVVGHVTMEGEWNPAHPTGETHWMAPVFGQHRRYLAHVARAFLAEDDVDAVLAEHASYPFVRGIRQKPTTASQPDQISLAAPGSMSDPKWRRGYVKLHDHGLHFELQAPWWHVEELLDLIAFAPDVPVVINHMFMPGTREPDVVAAWKDAIVMAASAPRTVIKISGMGIAGRPWCVDDHRALIAHAVETFGPERCMVASNFPVDRLCGDFATIIGGYAQILRDIGLSDGEQAALFRDTALRVYRIDPASVAFMTADNDA